MRISADTSHLQNHLTPQQSPGALTPQQKQPSVSFQPQTTSVASSTGRVTRFAASSSYATGPYHRAIRAYQEASRFENNPTLPLRVSGNIVGEHIRGNESALTEILHNDPQQSAAWYDLGLIYASRGDRDKVSTVYQVLQKLDPLFAEGFSTSAGLHEKILLDVI